MPLEAARKFAEGYSDLVIDVRELSAAEGLDDIRNCMQVFIGNMVKASKSKSPLFTSEVMQHHHAALAAAAAAAAATTTTSSPPPQNITKNIMNSYNGSRRRFFDSVSIFNPVSRKERKLSRSFITA